MVDIPNVGELLRDPQALDRFVADSQSWLADNAYLLGGTALGVLAVCGAASFGTAAIAKWMRERREDARRFGGKREARRANLLRNPGLLYSGIPIGRIGRHYLCWIDEEPLLVTGGTRSGKGVGVIRPACLTYGGPMVMYDGGKGELFRDTSGYRKRFSHVINFDLSNPAGAHWNPLDEIDPGNPVAGADALALAIPRPEKANEHFELSAERLVAAVVLHVLHGEPDERKNMARVVELLSQGDPGMEYIAWAAAHPVAVARVNTLFGGNILSAEADDGQKYRRDVYNSALVRLSAFEDPVVAKVTSRSDFRMRDVFRRSDTRRPVSLYLTTPASHDKRLRPVVSLFVSMFIDSVLAEQPALEGEPKTLIVLDEFPSLRMAQIQTAITKIVGLGATFLLGAQSLNALQQEPYGPRNLFRDNIRCHVAFAANDGLTQREISQSAGTVRERRTSTSRSRSPGSWGRSSSETESEVEVPVINPGKVREVGDDKELVFITGQPVIKARKIVDFEDRILRRRLKLPPAALRGADGVYPDLPHPARPSPWAGVMTARVREEPGASFAPPEDDGAGLPASPEWGGDDPEGFDVMAPPRSPVRPAAGGKRRGGTKDGAKGSGKPGRRLVVAPPGGDE